mmetsp:Transcript_2580/g.6197  ORF Transcript_2580/g.6197 Transcript_2580/m.6197 type:complete len:307 (-) Transcript_2580:415-1335(-)
MQGRRFNPKSATSLSSLAFTSMLSENFRMNASLCAFTAQLYGPLYKPQTPMQRCEIDEGSTRCNIHPLDTLFQGSHLPPLSLVRLEQPSSVECEPRSYEVDLEYEASVVADLIERLVRHCPGTSVFVVSPHRAQRLFIREAVSQRLEAVAPSYACGPSKDSPFVYVDTVERMQGQQAPVVVYCCGFLDPDAIANERAFLFDRCRLNVAFSRAKAACVLICGSALMSPTLPLSLADHPSARAGWTFLQAFMRATEVTVTVAGPDMQDADLAHATELFSDLDLSEDAHTVVLPVSAQAEFWGRLRGAC